MTLLLRAVAALLLLAAPAFAQTYPNKQVRIVVPFPAGGSADILCRLVGEKLSTAWGQTVIIDNRAGAGGNVGAEIVYRAEPDGYTLLCSPPGPLSINHNLYKTLPYDWTKFVPIGVLALVPNVITARADLPAASLQEFIAYAKANPGKATYASQGNGSTSHLSASNLATLAGIELVHVPYKGGGPATVALLAGEVPVMFGGNSVTAHIKAGRLRGLAVAGKKRSVALPELPTLSEFYPGLEVTAWIGIFAPANVPAPVLARLHGEVNRLLVGAQLRDKVLAVGGLEPFVTTPDEFTALIRAEYAKYGEVVKTTGVKID